MAKPGASNAQTRVRFPPPALSWPSGSTGRLSEMKTDERREARRLRAVEGESIKQIARLLSVSPSTVSVWVRDIELTDEQHAALQERCTSHNGQTVSAFRRSARARARRRAEQDHGRVLACSGDLLHQAGCMLYWAEGARERNAVVFTNSDPEMIRFFTSFLRRCYGVGADRIVITCNLFTDPRGAAAARDRGILARSARSSGKLVGEIDRERVTRNTARKSGGTSSPTEPVEWSSTTPRSSSPATAPSRSTRPSNGPNGSTRAQLRR